MGELRPVGTPACPRMAGPIARTFHRPRLTSTDPWNLSDKTEWVESTAPAGRQRARLELFTVDVARQTVPGALWLPPSGVVSGLVLMGHGGGRHKLYGRLTQLAERLAADWGIASASIDAPFHGERRPTDLEPEARPPMPDIDQVVAEWLSVLSALRSRPEIGDVPVGYHGLSMGCRHGLALLAAAPRIRAAVLGLLSGREARVFVEADKVRAPVLFLMQWDDELISRDGALGLFDRIGSFDKRLHAYRGRHSDLPEEGLRAAEAFLSSHLAADPNSPDGDRS